MSEHDCVTFEPGEASRAAPETGAQTGRMPSLALLYSDEALLAHVEAVLGEIGAAVVYRAPVAGADREQLLAARPGIALINLDDRCDDRLEQVNAWLDAAQVQVVFNDADTSRGLDGWERARWTRHLAAKLRGSADVDPPRPVQAAPTQAAPVQNPQAAVAEQEDDTAMAHAFDNDTAEFTQIVPIASRPLTPGEIESLVADFPSEPAMTVADIDAQPANDDTDAMAAHVDALLAEQAAAAPAPPAPWEVVVPLEDIPAAAAANSPVPVVQPAAASIPSPTRWQLVDDIAPVVSAPREKAADSKPAPRIEFDFELEPLEVSVPTAFIREREVQEMRLDRVAAKSPEASA